MIEVREITAAHKADINIPNEPFALFGRMEVSRADGKWGHSEVLFAEEDVSEMCFPDENYDFEAMQENTVFLGAYDGEKCVGLAILQKAFFKYMYLYDLKVSGSCRGQGVGRALMAKAGEVCKARGYRGIYTQGQDNNLGACRFYLKAGFRIGGLDTEVYKGTKQEGKADILFYWDV
jgi:ribosomal protein S18 acetylase RimI-like enzyme